MTHSWARKLFARPTSTVNRRRLHLEALEGRLTPTTYMVTTLSDGGVGSLRQAILDANGHTGADDISFKITGTINLAGALPDLSTDINIHGPGASLLTVRRNTVEEIRIFTVTSGTTVTLSGLTVANGWSSPGGISNAGTLTLNNATISGNVHAGLGNTGTMTLNNVSVTGNDSGGDGGGIWNGGMMTLNNSTVSGNTTPLSGGGIFNGGTLLLNNSTVSNNQSWWYGSGGGIFNTGTATISGSTVSNNYADAYGGGIFAGGILRTHNTIIADNEAYYGATSDLAGSVESLGHNLIGSTSAGTGFRTDLGDLLNVNPLLGPLADNGGPTKTHALLPGSPAINAGDPAATGDFDQRGFPRIVRGRIDIGAYEAPIGASSTSWVTNLADSGIGSLRQAILDDNATPGDDAIAFTATGTINLAGALPDLSTNIDIHGPGANLLTVRRNAGGQYRIFTVTSGATVVLTGLTITNGNLFEFDRGGGISNGGTLTLNNAAVNGNTAAWGGGLYNTGTLTLNSTTVVGNYRGGIVSFGTLAVRNSAVSGNGGADQGGGIYNSGVATVDNSTVSGNAAFCWGCIEGGGIFNAGTLDLNNSTVSGNTGFYAGGIANYGTLTLTSATITANSANTDPDAGGVWNGGAVNARNTIIAGNTAPGAPDFRGTIDSLGHNLIGNTSGGSGFRPELGDLLDVNPLLGPLADNGGPTKTHALLPGSPAINAGANPAGLTGDQRGVAGFVRTFGAGTDIGAFEFQPQLATVVNDGSAQRSRVTSLTATFTGVASFSGTVGSAFTLSRVSDGAVVNFTATQSIVNGVTVVTLNGFTGSATDNGSLADGRFTLTADATRITIGGAALDGDGHGGPGGNFVFGSAQGLFRFFGDVNGDQNVNGLDFGFFKNAFGTQVGDANYLSYFDFNGDGVINGFDFGQFRTRFGTMLP